MNEVRYAAIGEEPDGGTHVVFIPYGEPQPAEPGFPGPGTLSAPLDVACGIALQVLGYAVDARRGKPASRIVVPQGPLS